MELLSLAQVHHNHHTVGARPQGILDLLEDIPQGGQKLPVVGEPAQIFAAVTVVPDGFSVRRPPTGQDIPVGWRGHDEVHRLGRHVVEDVCGVRGDDLASVRVVSEPALRDGDILGVDVHSDSQAPELAGGKHGGAQAAEGVENHSALGRQETLDHSARKLDREESGMLQLQLILRLADVAPDADGVARPRASVQGVAAASFRHVPSLCWRRAER